jgi:Transposase
MESTGIYCKSSFAALEAVSIIDWVLNTRHVKAVPDRKSDTADAQWPATLARVGLLGASFIAKADLRNLQNIARQRQKLGGMLASEKNRLHKLLTNIGIRLGMVALFYFQFNKISIICIGPIHAGLWMRFEQEFNGGHQEVGQRRRFLRVWLR